MPPAKRKPTAAAGKDGAASAAPPKRAKKPPAAAAPVAAPAEPPKKKKAQRAAAEPAAAAEPRKKQKKAPAAVAGAVAGATTALAKAAASSAAASSAAAGPPKLEREQVARAVRALCTHLERRAAASRSLLDDAEQISVVLTTKRMGKAKAGAALHKPVRLELPHALRTLGDASVCLITKDPQREWKDKLEAQQVSAKVIGISKLAKKYVPYEAKRQLCDAHDLFLADERVLPKLPALLGKTFFKKKKLPLAIRLTKGDLKAELEKCVGASYYRPTNGTTCSFAAGTSAQPAAQIVENVIAAVEQVAPRVNGWRNVLALHLKATNTVALPFYHSLPHAG